MKTLFLSYCTTDTVIADLIENKLQSILGSDIKISRYTHDVKYKDSFKKFMNSISSHDYVLTIVSDSYLKSKACMYEVGEIIKDHNFIDKIFFVIISNKEMHYYRDAIDGNIAADIYSDKGQISYIKFWERERQQLEESLGMIESNSAKISSLKKLTALSKIIDYDIRPFMDYLYDANGKSFEYLFESDFEDIITLINPDYNQFSDSSSYEALFEKAMNTLAEITNSDYNQIVLSCAIETHALALVVFADAIPHNIQPYRRVALSGLVCEAFAKDITINARNVKEHKGYFCAVGKTKSELVIPIRLNQKVIGVFNSESESYDHYSDIKIRKLTTILNYFALALNKLGYRQNMFINDLPYVSI